jgi:ABC-type glycerol-3-phosphate transport system substrate-binding protein
MPKRFQLGLAISTLMAGALLLGTTTASRAEDATLEVWTHEADESAKVAFRELAARNLEKANPASG